MEQSRIHSIKKTLKVLSYPSKIGLAKNKIVEKTSR
jgi:hypothetical protein